MSLLPVLKFSQKARSANIDKRRKRVRALFLGALIVGLLAQSLSLVALVPAQIAVAATPDATTPNSSTPLSFVSDSKQKVVSIMQQEPDAGPVNVPNAFSPKARPAALTPALTLYAYKTSDDTGTATLANCNNASAAGNCSLRSALALATSHNPSASSAVLVLTLPSATYGVTKVLPVVPSYTIVSSTADQSCPASSSFSNLQPAAALSGVKGFTLTGSNSVINGIAVTGFPSDGIFISGPNNTISCSLISNNGYSGILVRGGKATGNVINNNLIGVTADAKTAFTNGTSSGSDVVCNPSTGGALSEDCNGIFLAGDLNGPVQGTRITGNTIAVGTQRVATGIMIDSGNNNTIQGNYIGTNQNLSAAFTCYLGIYIFDNSNNNVVGGDASLGQGNLIGNYVAAGIAIYATDLYGSSTTSNNNNLVEGNAIGVDFNGNSNANLTPKSGPNDQGYAIGVVAGNTANSLVGTTIGSNSGQFDNLLGNSKYGIYVSGQGVSSSQINGNLIGVSKNGNPTANTDAGSQVGIYLSNVGSFTTIQNNIIGAANLTSSPTVGLQISGFVQNSLISHNDIEANTQGIALALTGSPSQNIITNNIIAHNGTGILVGANSGDNSTQRVTITQNSIYANSASGINLNYPSGNGVSGGSDSGPNNQAQPPTIQSVTNGANNALTVSGQASPNSIVEIFQADTSTSQAQGSIYLGSATANSSGSFTASGLTASALTSNAALVATSTLTDPAFSKRVGSTSAFSNAYSADLSLSPDELNFKILTSTTTTSQSVNLSTQLSSANFTSNISYGAGATGWLAVSPSSGSVSNNNPTKITATVTNSSLPIGTYTATVTFTDSATNFSVSLNVQLTVLGGGYTYYLPFLANNYKQPNTSGSFTTYLAFQNVGSATANVNVAYFDSTGVTLTASTVITQVAQNGESLPPNPFSSSQNGTGIITSDQPLNVIVPEGTPYGGSAYVINSGGASSLVAPLAINGAFGGYITQLTVFNGSNTNSNVTVNFYSQDGSPAPSSSTQTFSLNPHTSKTFAQNDPSSGLPNNFNGWAQITGAAGSQLTAQVLEQNPNAHFVAIANAQPVPFGQSTLYAPAIFNQAFGAFVTGVNIVNPNANSTPVTITYYDNTGKVIGTPTSQSLAGHGVLSVYQPALSYLEGGFYGSAQVSGSDLVMVVNENGGVTATGNVESGVYNGIASGGGAISLPVISNGGFGYTTGATVLNAGTTAETITITYFDTTGANKGQTNYTIQPHASQPIYQGNANLPSGFYGTAQITTSDSSANLLVTTNAISPAFFYTYTEPAS